MPIGVTGVSGYAGGELARLLLRHPRIGTANVRLYGRAGSAGETLAALHPHLHDGSAEFAALSLAPLDFDAMAADGVSVLFLATPHEQSRAWVPEALARGIRVVDLSGAWRLRSAANRAIYKFDDEGEEQAAGTQELAVYGSPELHAGCIAKARLVANPGCYATSIILALAPVLRAGLVDVERGIICDAKSGVSGAGKAATAKTHFMYAADNLSAYGVFAHRHTGELLEQLHLQPEEVVFTPHLLPIPRGILSTCYVTLKRPSDLQQITNIFDGFYSNAPMVRVRGGELPQIQWVVNTSYCDLGFALDAEGKRLIVVSCLDNLLKGAAGQAVQNMNLMLGFPEQEGLL